MCWRSTSALLASDTSYSSPASALSAMSLMTIDNNDGWIFYSSGWTTSGCSKPDGAGEVAASLHCVTSSSMDRPALAVFTFNGRLTTADILAAACKSFNLQVRLYKSPGGRTQRRRICQGLCSVWTMELLLLRQARHHTYTDLLLSRQADIPFSFRRMRGSL